VSTSSSGRARPLGRRDWARELPDVRHRESARRGQGVRDGCRELSDDGPSPSTLMGPSRPRRSAPRCYEDALTRVRLSLGMLSPRSPKAPRPRHFISIPIPETGWVVPSKTVLDAWSTKVIHGALVSTSN
jgi:hypothetical protein